MSIAEAIENAQTRVSAVYDKCEEKGAKLPETKNLANLPSTIDSIPAGGGGDVVKAYVSGVNLWKPGYHYEDGFSTSSVHDENVLLTKVGYQATGSETFSPNVRPTIINENGFVIAGGSRYEILNGVVDESTKTSVTSQSTTSATHFFMHNGAVSVSYQSPTMTYGGTNVDFYTITNNASSIGFNNNTSYKFLDWCVCDARYSGDIRVVNEDLTIEKITLSSYLSGVTDRVFVFGTRYLFYVVYPASDSGTTTWGIAKFRKIDGNYVTTPLNLSATVTQRIFWATAFGLVFVNTKTQVQTTNGEVHHCLGRDGFINLEINYEDETQSRAGFYNYPQNVLGVMGDRTIAVIQTFYDGTFSLCLSEGTTLICKFTSATGVEILQVIEPFIVEGDSTVYYRNFTATKMFWWQSGATNAPISAKPYGPYNATKATVDWLAVPREDNRWNTTVLTGVIRMGAQTAKPEFDETDRRVIDVETAIKDTAGLIVGRGDWTLDDLNKVNGTM